MSERYIVDQIVTYEVSIAELMANSAALGAIAGNYIALYLTVLSGYLIAAYVAGPKLKPKQVKLINTMFIISSFFFSSNALFAFFDGNLTILPYMGRAEQNVIYGWLVFDSIIWVTMILGIFACLRFMKDACENP